MANFLGKLLLFGFFLCASLTGCSPSLGTIFHFQPPISPQKAVVYLYRLKEGMEPGYPIGISADKFFLGSLPFNSYVRYEVASGEVEFSTKFLLGYTESVTLDTEANATYFLKVEMRAGGFLINHAIITRIFPEEAIQEIRYCRQVLAKNKNTL